MVDPAARMSLNSRPVGNVCLDILLESAVKGRLKWVLDKYDKTKVLVSGL